MKITPLPLVEEIEHEVGTVLDGEVHTKCTYHAYVILKDSFSELIQRDELAYTSLIEGIEGMKSNPMLPVDDCLYSRSCIDREVDKALDDIIEKVVKPLYGKRPGDNASTK